METLTSQVKKIQGDVFDGAHKVWLAGLGAVAVVEEESTRMFDRLVTRGKKVEAEGKKEVEKVQREVKKAQKRAETTLGQWQGTMETRLNRLVEKLGIPQRDQIRLLADRVEELTAKVEAAGGMITPAEPLVRKVYHLLPNEEGWSIKAEGNERATSTHTTKDEALAAGRELAQRQAPSQLVVHRLDGTVQTAYTYDEPVAVA